MQTSQNADLHSNAAQTAAVELFGDASVSDPTYPVTLPTGQAASWNISQNLTDRWGEINPYKCATKPLSPLVEQPELYERLLNQMWDELTFVVRKDGQYGVLFEQEYPTKTSEVNLMHPSEPGYQAEMDALKSEEELSPILVRGIAKLAVKYPTVQFCLPPKEEMVEERLGLWAFVADGLLDEATLEQLGLDILAI